MDTSTDVNGLASCDTVFSLPGACLCGFRRQGKKQPTSANRESIRRAQAPQVLLETRQWLVDCAQLSAMDGSRSRAACLAGSLDKHQHDDFEGIDPLKAPPHTQQ